MLCGCLFWRFFCPPMTKNQQVLDKLTELTALYFCGNLPLFNSSLAAAEIEVICSMFVLSSLCVQVVEAVPILPEIPLPAIQPNYRPLPSIDVTPLSPQRRKGSALSSFRKSMHCLPPAKMPLEFISPPNTQHVNTCP